jgi:hypothetical protein
VNSSMCLELANGEEWEWGVSRGGGHLKHLHMYKDSAYIKKNVSSPVQII